MNLLPRPRHLKRPGFYRLPAGHRCSSTPRCLPSRPPRSSSACNPLPAKSGCSSRSSRREELKFHSSGKVRGSSRRHLQRVKSKATNCALAGAASRCVPRNPGPARGRGHAAPVAARIRRRLPALKSGTGRTLRGADSCSTSPRPRAETGHAARAGGSPRDFKLNEFQLYFEHTFAYRNFKPVWRAGAR